MTIFKSLLATLLLSVFFGVILALVVVIGYYPVKWGPWFFLPIGVVLNVIAIAVGYTIVSMSSGPLAKHPLALLPVAAISCGLVILLSVVVAWDFNGRFHQPGVHLYAWGMTLGYLWAVIDAFQGKLEKAAEEIGEGNVHK